MQLELLSLNNYCTYNIKLAKTIGLQAAVYCAALASLMNNDSDEFIKLDRNKLYELTALTIDDQLSIESKLANINLVTKTTSFDDVVSLDVTLMINLIANEDLKLQQDTRARMEKNLAKESKQRSIARALKNAIVTDSIPVKEAAENWIDQCLSQGNKALSKMAVETFMENVKQATADPAEQVAIINIAAVSQYRTATWAIKEYQQSKRNLNNMTSVTIPKSIPHVPIPKTVIPGGSIIY